MVLTNIIGVQGDGLLFMVTVYSSGGLHFFVNNTLRQALGQPSFRAPTRNLWKMNAGLLVLKVQAVSVQTLKQVQGDGLRFRVTVFGAG